MMVSKQSPDINLNVALPSIQTGLDFSPAQFQQVTSIDPAAWKAELALHAELFQQLAYHLPDALVETKAQIQARLEA